jgi:hypothetical protein
MGAELRINRRGNKRVYVCVCERGVLHRFYSSIYYPCQQRVCCSCIHVAGFTEAQLVRPTWSVLLHGALVAA